MKCTFIIFSTIILAVRAIRCFSPIQDLEPGAMCQPCGRCAVAILADRQQPKTNRYDSIKY